MGQGPGTSSQSSPRPGGSSGDDKYLLHVDQAVAVTVIISTISAGVMRQYGRCQQQVGPPHFLMAGEASGKQMLLEDEQQGGWAFSLESPQSEHQFWVVGSGHICILLLSLHISESGDIAEECYGAGIRPKSPNQVDLSVFLGSKPEG